MVEFACVRLQTEHGVTQALPMRQLTEGHAEVLFPTGEVPDFVISKMLVYNGLELLVGNRSHDLEKT